jgi:hypothetical protein
MDSRFYNTPTLQAYASLWNKYRPVILQLMMNAQNGTQEYKLFGHEFRALNPKEKSYTFQIHGFQGKIVNSTKASAVAQDLISALNLSKKAMELMDTTRFEFSLDKHFVFRVSKVEQPAS